MATYNLQLDSVSVDDGRINIHMRMNGAKFTVAAFGKDDLHRIADEFQPPTQEDLVRFAIHRIRQVDPNFDNPSLFTGKTLTVTIDAEVA